MVLYFPLDLGSETIKHGRQAMHITAVAITDFWTADPFHPGVVRQQPSG
jgi:hypothetical protein